MSYDDHTDCGFCRRHSVACWCYSTNLWTDETKNDRAVWCHKPDDPSLHVPQPPSVLRDDGDVLGRIRDAYRLIESAPPRRTEPIKLTEQQIAAIRAQQPERPAWDSGVVADLFAVPVVKVDTVGESTPHLEAPKYATGGLIRRGELGPLLDEGGCSYVIPNRYDPNAKPGGIINIPGKLTDEEFRQFERRWRWTLKADGNALRIINEDGSKGAWFGRRPPWWKRAYYRVRRWLA